MDTYSKALIGSRSRASGEYFEGMISAACQFYEEKGISVIEKTPEPMRVLKPYDRKRGQFICCFAKQAQPDFKGILMDATMVLFDAKHTDKERIMRDVVTEEQESFLVVSIGLDNFYRVPWVVFRDMKKIYGHKYMDRKDLETYKIRYSNGVLRFLDGIELREGGRS